MQKIFIRQIGAFFLAIAFGKIVNLTGNYDKPMFVISAVSLGG